MIRAFKGEDLIAEYRNTSSTAAENNWKKRISKYVTVTFVKTTKAKIGNPPIQRTVTVSVEEWSGGKKLD
jgi:hypothetical protein